MSFLTNTISRAFGKIADYEFSPVLQSAINKSYVSFFSIDMDEFDEIESYPSLNKLFTRKLKKQRAIAGEEDIFCSPCDALMTEIGRVKDGMALQIKGMPYHIWELLSSNDEAKKCEDGLFMNFYLSPKDYHRYHAPVNMTIKWAVYIPGGLNPVNKPALNKIDSLFTKNERVALCCEDEKQRTFYLIFIGALNVGRMVFEFDERIQTNAKKETISLYDYENMKISKGVELGRFEMGSSIVALLPKEYKSLVNVEQKVRFGEAVAKF